MDSYKSSLPKHVKIISKKGKNEDKWLLNMCVFKKKTFYKNASNAGSYNERFFILQINHTF